MSADDWHRALNVNLPPTIRVLSSETVKKDFHARFSAKSKTYKYVMDTSLILGPHKFLRTWHHPKKINISKLKEACSLYEGTHDFASFAVNRGDGKDIKTERTIFSVEVNSDQEDTLIISFSGNGFFTKWSGFWLELQYALLRTKKTLVGYERCSKIQENLNASTVQSQTACISRR